MQARFPATSRVSRTLPASAQRARDALLRATRIDRNAAWLRGFRDIASRDHGALRGTRSSSPRFTRSAPKRARTVPEPRAPPLRASFHDMRTDIQGNGGSVPPFLIPLESKGHGQEEGKEEGDEEGDEEGSSQEVVRHFDSCY
jgi:hypothetical protein